MDGSNAARYMAIVAALYSVGAGSVRATQLFAENFSYIGQLTENGWSTLNTEISQIQSDGSVVTLRHFGGVDGQDVASGFATQSAIATTYYGFDLTLLSGEPVSNGFRFTGLKDASGNGIRARTQALPPDMGGDFTLGISTDGPVPTSPSLNAALTFGTTYRVVVSYNAGSGVSDLSIEGVGSVSSQDLIPITGTLIEQVELCQNGGAVSNQLVDMDIDNISVATTFNEALNSTNPSIGLQIELMTHVVAPSSNAVFAFTVANSGDVAFSNVEVTNLLAPDCNLVIPNMAAGMSTSYFCEVTNVTADFTISAWVEGTPPVGPKIVESSEMRVGVIPTDFSATISWEAPLQNEDQTPLTDLAGFKMYLGQQSQVYTEIMNVGNQTTSTIYALDRGTVYYFAVTAYDYSGNESGFSDEIQWAAGDIDVDGVQDSWEQTFFPRTSLSDVGPSDDGDGDGISNLAEYIVGSNPTNVFSFFAPNLDIGLSNNQIRVSFTALNPASGPGYEGYSRRFSLQDSLSGVDAWQAVRGYADLESLGQAVSYIRPFGSTNNYYYRVEIWLELADEP